MPHIQGVFELTSTADVIIGETQTDFASLSLSQLNWQPKPSANQWSIAQCFDHLVTANETHFPTSRSFKMEKKRIVFRKCQIV